MNNSIVLLERVRLTTPNRSKEQTIKLLRMERSVLFGIYAGKRYPNHEHCIEISRVLRIDLRSVLSYVAADKARSETTKARILEKLPRLLPAAGFALAVIAGGLITTSGTSAQTAQREEARLTPVYIMRTHLRRFRRTWGSGLDDIFRQLAAAA